MNEESEAPSFIHEDFSSRSDGNDLFGTRESSADNSCSANKLEPSESTFDQGSMQILSLYSEEVNEGGSQKTTFSSPSPISIGTSEGKKFHPHWLSAKNSFKTHQ
jgi:hypothetical protein